MKKFPKIKKLRDSETDGIFLHDDDWVTVMEKIDGANFRWKYFNDDQILAGSRRTDFKRGDEPLPIDECNKQFRHVLRYLHNELDFEELRKIEEEYGEIVFFGEALHKHTIDYDAWDGKHPEIDSEFPNYLGFDVWSVEEDRWLPHSEVIELHERIGLVTVPVVAEGTVDELSEDVLDIPKSEYRTEKPDDDSEFNRKGLAEGIIIKNDNQQLRAKDVAEKMKELHNWGQKTSSEKDIEELRRERRHSELFVQTFVTEQRILKTVHKLIDEGKYDEIRMEMMADLPRRVLTDVFAEEGWNIITHEYEIELDEEIKESIRKKTSTKCSRLLQSELDSL